MGRGLGVETHPLAPSGCALGLTLFDSACAADGIGMQHRRCTWHLRVWSGGGVQDPAWSAGTRGVVGGCRIQRGVPVPRHESTHGTAWARQVQSQFPGVERASARPSAAQLA